MIYIHKSWVEEIEARLGKFYKKAPTVIVRALNRAVVNARTNVVKKAREEYYIKATDVRSVIKLTRATRNTLKAKIYARDTRRELINFRVRPRKPSHKKRPKVLRVAVKKDRLTSLPGAFVARGTSSGKLHVLKRVTEKRYPLHIKYGPAIPQMIGQPKIRIYVEQEARAMFEKRLDHEIERLLNRR